MSKQYSNGTLISAHTEAPKVPPVTKEPPSPPNWTAIAAIFLSVITFFKTLWSDRRSDKQKAQSKFETDFGTPIRNGLRDYEKHIRSIRIYTLASTKTVDELKEEIGKSRPAWLDAAFDIERLLNEADSSGKTKNGSWSDTWMHHTNIVEEHMIAMTDDSNSVDELSSHAKNAKQEMEVSLAAIRRLLQEHVDTY